MRNRRILIYGTLSAILLLGLAGYLFLRLYDIIPGVGEGQENVEFDEKLYSAVPSDAILVCDIANPAAVLSSITDTTLLGRIFNGAQDALYLLDGRLFSSSKFKDAHTLFSLHYSSKKKISFLQIMDAQEVGDAFSAFVTPDPAQRRNYDGAVIETTSGGVVYSIFEERVLASNSPLVLESAIRHISNSSSILDSKDFVEVAGLKRSRNSIVVRNSQTGKIFSSIVAPKSVKYADYSQKFATWTISDLSASEGALHLRESFVNRQEADCLDYIYSEIPGKKSLMGEIIPATAVVAVSYTVDDIPEYYERFKRYLEANKRLMSHAGAEREIRNLIGTTPLGWMDTLKVDEAVCALCQDDGEYEWITALRGSVAKGGFLSGLFSKEQDTVIKPFTHQGCAEHIFGRFFGNTIEESYVERDGWTIIGRGAYLRKIMNEKFKILPLEEYLSQTPASDLLKREAAARVYVNVSDFRDTLALRFLPFLGSESADKLFAKYNAVIFSASVRGGQKSSIADLELFYSRVEDLTKERKIVLTPGKAEGMERGFPKHEGPFILKDFANGGNCTLEQLEDNALQYTTSLGKQAWTIRFPGPLAGCVEQADLFHNGKLQMIFVHKNKLYALDRLGRFVSGYPVTLQKDVAYGPALYKVKGGKGYYVAVINTDNTVTVTGIGGAVVEVWQDIELEEFIGDFPQLVTEGKEQFWRIEILSGAYDFRLNGTPVTK